MLGNTVVRAPTRGDDMVIDQDGTCQCRLKNINVCPQTLASALRTRAAFPDGVPHQSFRCGTQAGEKGAELRGGLQETLEPVVGEEKGHHNPTWIMSWHQ